MATTGLLLAVAGGAISAWDVRTDVTSRLDERADRIAAVVELELQRYRGASHALAAVRATDPDQDAWIEQVERLGIADDLPSVFNLAAATLEGGDGTDQRLVLDRVAPLGPNEAAIGLDLLTVPAAGPATRRAVEDREAALSDALTLVQETGDQAGLVVYAPWFDADGEVGGVTDIVVRGQDFLEALAPELGEVAVEVTDLATPTGPRVIGVMEVAGGVEEDLTTTRTISPLGQEWQLDVTAPAGFTSRVEGLAPWLTFAGLLAVTLLVAALAEVLQRRASHARAEVAARTAELLETNRELQEALEAKDEFLAVIAHEFRTPITVIRGFAETASAGRSGDLPATTLQWLDRIDRQARRLHGLLDNVLTAARLQSGRLTVEPETVEIDRLVTAVTAQHTELGRVDVVCERVSVEVDPVHLVRILDALLDNAGKYGHPPVRVTATRAGGQGVIRVLDHGDGVPPEVRDRLFERFQQADGGSTRRSRGVGLGLAVVRDLCERMGGSVGLVEVDGAGACFEVRLPLSDAGPEGPPAVASPSPTTDEG